MKRVLALMGVLLGLSLACNVVSRTSSEIATPEPTPALQPNPQLPPPTQATNIPAQPTHAVEIPDETYFVVITAPEAGSRVNVNGFTVSGQQRGSFENSVSVQALDANGTLLQEVTTTAIGELGQVGTWEVTLNPTNAPLNTRGTIYAYYTSPRDGSQQAYWQIEVMYVNP